MLAVDPGFHPAIVLAAQADFVDGDYPAVVDAVTPVTAELPGYTAAELLLGRAGELAGAPVVAFAAYWQASEASPTARERLAELKPRAVEIVGNRVRDALARGRLDEADDGARPVASLGARRGGRPWRRPATSPAPTATGRPS